jgi:lipopolysaccharide export system permease protein
MTIFGRYVFRQTTTSMLLILFSLGGVVWIALALKQLKLVTTKGQDLITLLSMTTLALPNLMALIAPIALLIAAIQTLNRLNSDSELIVLTASGATIWRVARPLLALALLVAIAISFVNHVAMPWSLRTLRAKVAELRSDLISQVLLPGRFSSPMSGITVHIRERTRDGLLLGILITDDRKPEASLTYLAEYGRISRSGASSFLSMRNGHIVRKEIKGRPTNYPPEILGFDTYAIDLNQFEQKFSTPRFKARELYFSELVNPSPEQLEHRKGKGAALGQLRAELHERLSNPLYPFAFVLIALAFVGQAQSTRTSQTRTIATGFLVATTFRLVGLAASNLAAVNAAAVPVMYLIPLAGMTLAVLMMHRNARPRARRFKLPPSVDRAVRALAEFSTRGWGRLPQAQGGK